MSNVCVYIGDELAKYSFGNDHPFGPKRHDAFVKEFKRQHLHEKVSLCEPTGCEEDVLSWFHTPEYIEKVKELSLSGEGYLDCGDTPAFLGMFNITSTVVGTTLNALDRIVEGECKQAFIPIAGLHHARRDSAAGFCVLNDIGIAIEVARRKYHLQKVAYVDIDAHHGDGVFYSFEDDPDLIFADLHEDGRYLYPGTGFAEETGKGSATGTKLNIPMPLGAGDSDFMREWDKVETYLRKAEPEIIFLQCGADSLGGDPITHMQYTEKAHAHAAKRLCQIADECCDGKVLAMGGGGYNLDNLARAWCAVVNEFVKHNA